MSNFASALRSQLSYANVMSTIAVFLALGTGGAYAASKLAANSVGTKQIRAGAVTKAKLAKGVVVAGPVGAAGTIGASGAPGATGATGPAGETGAAGLAGATGPAGPVGATGAAGTRGDAGAPGSPGAKGDPGVQGVAGPQGDKGDPGDQGPRGFTIKGDTGPPGPITGTLPSGVQQTGIIGVSVPDGTPIGSSAYMQMSFPLALPGDTPATVIVPGGAKTLDCSGTVYLPTATAGHLCVYLSTRVGLSIPSAIRIASADNQDGDTGLGGLAGPTGGILLTQVQTAPAHYMRGSWAVRAL